jgi:hypothetical protein
LAENNSKNKYQNVRKIVSFKKTKPQKIKEHLGIFSEVGICRAMFFQKIFNSADGCRPCPGMLA